MNLKKVMAAAMISLLATGAIVGCGGGDKKKADAGKKVQIEYCYCCIVGSNLGCGG